MDDKLIDFIFSRMNDFERLSHNEPSNYTAIETVRFCADILYRFGVNICCVNGVWQVVNRSGVPAVVRRAPIAQAE